MDATTTRHLHYTYAQLAGQLLACLTIVLAVLGASLIDHYGDPSTYNEGYVLGGDTAAVELGLEVRGAPGLFGHLATPLGTIGDTETITPAAVSLVQVGSDEVPDQVWQDMLAHGATSDPSDGCECLYAQVGSLYGPAGHQWTITSDGAEPAGAN